LAEERAAEEIGARLFDAAQGDANQVEGEDLPGAGAVAFAPDFVQRGQPDFGKLRRADVLRGCAQGGFEYGLAPLLYEFGEGHIKPNSFAASTISRAMGAATLPP